MARKLRRRLRVTRSEKSTRALREADIHLTRVSTLDRVVHDLRLRLLGGAIPDDRPLPTVRALARRESVSQATAQAAYQQLEAEGLVEARPRIGRFAVRLSARKRRRQALAILREALRAPVADALAIGLSRTLIRTEMLRLLKSPPTATLP